MGGGSRPRGRGFKSRHQILDGHFSHYIAVKSCDVCLKGLKINDKKAEDGPFFFKKKTEMSNM